MSKVNTLPGCFGSPACYQPKTDLCKSCPLMATCQVQSKQRAERLRVKYGLDVFKGIITQEDGTVKLAPRKITQVPKKAEELLDRLRMRGIDLKRSVQSHNNPFATQPPAFMRIAMGDLLTSIDGLSSRDLATRYKNALGWTDASASSHVGIALGALRESGAVVEHMGRFVPCTHVGAQ